ncbi:MAG: DNA primase [Bacilli bacterium]|nr:DNA primase [Bacilli bacterium]
MIPEEIVEDIRRKADIVQIISSYINVIKKGNSYVAICPFHADSNPSLHISQEKQIYKCFACGAGGNVFTFVEKYEKCSYMDAIKKVADMIGYHHESLNKVERVVDKETSKICSCLKEASNFYQFSLNTQGGAEAKKYFESRNISQEMISYFSLGFSPDDSQISISILMNKGYDIDTLDNAGILVRNASSYSDRFSGRVMFPLYNEFSEVIGFSGRRIKDSQEAKYVNSPNTVLFNKSKILYNYQNAKNEAKKEGYVYVVEGFMDVFALYQVGIKSCVALMGTAFTPFHAKLLRKLNVEIRLCLDGDDAGQHAMIKMCDILDKEQLNYRIVNYDEIKDDPDEILQGKGPIALKELLNNLFSKYDFVFEYYKKENPLKTIEDRKKFASELISYVSNINDNLEQDIFINKISQYTGIEKSTLLSLVKKNIDKEEYQMTQKAFFEKKETKRVLNRIQNAEKQIMHFLLTSDEAIEDYRRRNKYFIDDVYGQIWEYIQDTISNNKFDIADLITKIQQQNPKNEEILVNTILELSISGKNQNLAPYSKEALDEVLQTYEIAVNKKNMDKTLSQNTFGKSPREKASIYDQYKKQQIR